MDERFYVSTDYLIVLHALLIVLYFLRCKTYIENGI